MHSAVNLVAKVNLWKAWLDAFLGDRTEEGPKLISSRQKVYDAPLLPAVRSLTNAR
jgi:hypothetical protein